MSLWSAYNKLLKQTVTYWAPKLENGVQLVSTEGQLLFENPANLKCRWSDVITVVMTASNPQYVSNASVMLAVAVVVGGYLKLGAVADLDSGATALNTEGSWRIEAVHKVPDFKAKNTLVTAYV